MTSRDFKDLPIIIASDKVLSNKAFDIAKRRKQNGYQSGLVKIKLTFRSSTWNVAV